MTQTPTPVEILRTLLPQLKLAAAYAQQIQAQIVEQPEKGEQDNPFGTALSDADLSVQTMVEVALLGHFPEIRFYGEEYEKSFNTKYFRAIDLGPAEDYLVTLDPIDGTRFYLDGHPNYQIILTVLNHDEYEAVLALFPSLGTYLYALRGQGVFQGHFADDLDQCQPIQIKPEPGPVFLGWGLAAIATHLRPHCPVIDLMSDYSRETTIPHLNGVLTGELAGAVIRKGKFIDGGAIAFMSQLGGAIVTTLDGAPPPPLHTCPDYERPGLIIANSPALHQTILQAIQAAAVDAS